MGRCGYRVGVLLPAQAAPPDVCWASTHASGQKCQGLGYAAALEAAARKLLRGSCALEAVRWQPWLLCTALHEVVLCMCTLLLRCLRLRLRLRLGLSPGASAWQQGVLRGMQQDYSPVAICLLWASV